MSGELKGDQKEVSTIIAITIDFISSTEGPFWSVWTKFVRLYIGNSLSISDLINVKEHPPH